MKKIDKLKEIPLARKKSKFQNNQLAMVLNGPVITADIKSHLLRGKKSCFSFDL